jgi:lambda family phage tail tape measure protein
MITTQDIAGAGDSLARLDTLAKGFERSIVSAFANGIVHGKQFGTLLQGVAQSLEQMALKAALQPLSGMIGNWMSGLAGPAGSMGSVFQNLGSHLGGSLPFADGGVVGTPTYFPLGRGFGLAGEAGPEAIMPLARGPDGKLGVRGAGAGAPVTVSVHITTPDPESFRRSEGLVSAQLARAVARGQRNL